MKSLLIFFAKLHENFEFPYRHMNFWKNAEERYALLGIISIKINYSRRNTKYLIKKYKGLSQKAFFTTMTQSIYEVETHYNASIQLQCVKIFVFFVKIFM
jgi:hypothetical protein